MARYIREGSGWTFGHVEQLEIHLNQFKPLKEASFISTLLAFAKKKAIINVKHEQWIILAAIHRNNKHANYAYCIAHDQYKKWEDELNFEGSDFPVSFKAIENFERQNPNYYVKVFGIDDVKKDEDGEEDLQKIREYRSYPRRSPLSDSRR